MIGRTVLHYTILSKLGEGGMGIVYEALDTRLGRHVAIKFLPPDKVADPKRRQRFRLEARTASSLNHPNIITIHEIASDGDSELLVMELVRGKTLHELQVQGITETDVLRYGRQIANALEAAHQAGVVHRDLKPGNVMITEEGAVKILDFGLAKLIEEDPAPAEASPLATAPTVTAPPTEPGMVVGTIGYMAPEQLRGLGADGRSDLFAFGALLYELATGRKAFSGTNWIDISHQICHEPPPRPRAVRPSVSEALERVILHALEKRPEDRYGSARLMGEDLEAIEAGREPAAPYRPDYGELRRRRARLAIVAVLLSAGALGVAAYFARPYLPAGWGQRPISELFAGRRLPDVKRVAVLAFENVGDDPSNKAFCDGLHQTLTSKLTQFGGPDASLGVLPASEAVRVRTVSEAQKNFGVNLVITGSVQRSGQQLRLTANLTDAASMMQLRSFSQDYSGADLVALQDQVVERIAGMLGVQPTQSERLTLATGNTRSASAYELYIQGLGHLQRFDRAGNIDLAIAAFEQALSLDSRYALALTGLSEAYWRKWRAKNEASLIERAAEAAARAVELSPELGEAYWASGVVLASRGDSDEAVRQLRRALEIQPRNPKFVRELAVAYEGRQQPDKAEETYLEAVRIDPNNWIHRNRLGIFLYTQAQYAKAEQAFRKTLELSPDNAIIRSNLGGVLIELARYPEAEQELKRALDLRRNANAFSNLGTVYFRLGRYEEAAAQNLQALSYDEKNHLLHHNLGDCYRWIPGQQEKARLEYQRAVELVRGALAINPKDLAMRARLAGYLAKSGTIAEALREIAAVERQNPSAASVWEKIVLVHTLAGDTKHALAALDKCFRAGCAVEGFRTDPYFASLRNEPEYVRASARAPRP